MMQGRSRQTLRRVLIAVAAAAVTLLGLVPAGGAAPAAAAVGASISGTVTGPGGAPLAGVVVTSVASVQGVSSTTAADGTYTLGGLADGAYRLQLDPTEPDLVKAWYGGASYDTASQVEIVGGASVTGIDVSIAQGGSIAGRVNGDGGAPLSGAWVTVFSTGGDFFGVQTAADGTYVARGVAQGGATLRFAGPSGGYYLDEYYQDQVNQWAATSVTVSAGATTAGIDAQLVLGGVIEGNLTGPAGQALAYVDVTATQIAGGATVSTIAGFDGHYELQAAPGQYTVRFSPPPGYGLAGEYFDSSPTQAGATPVTVTAAARTTANAQLIAAGSISGTVTDPNGTPVADVPVSITGPHGSEYAWTDAAGHYGATNVAAGSYTVHFEPSTETGLLAEYYNDAATEAEATHIDVTSGGAVTVDVQLALGGTITGTVTAADGSSLAGGLVSVNLVDGSGGAWADIAADGTYTVRGLRDGTYSVYFAARNDSSVAPEWYDDARSLDAATPVSVAASAVVRHIDAVLEVGGVISGTVTGPTGAPLGGITVTVSSNNDWRQVESAPDGSYTARGLVTGSYVVGFEKLGVLDSDTPAPEYYQDVTAAEDATPVGVVLGQVVSGIDARLNPSAMVEVHLVDGSAAPVSYARVEVLTTADRSLAAGSQAGSLSWEGTATVDGLRRGTSGRIVVGRASADTPFVAQYYVAGGPTTSSFDAATVLPLTSPTQQVSMTLRTGGQVTGVVRRADGSPVMNHQVVAFVDDGSLASRSALTGADGSYVIRGLLPGAYRVAVAPSSETESDTFYLSGTRPASPNVSVVGTGTTSGIDITLGTRFTDVQPTYPFASYISWLAGRGISTGWVNADGSAQFRPTESVTREAMAAFLYRDIAPVGFVPPGVSAFSDVPTSYPFFSFVSWLADRGISTGWLMQDGTREFRPTQAVSREAMAAFLYRAAGSPAYSPPVVSPFADVATSYPFYKQIAWLAEQGISTGWVMPDGSKEFRPTTAVTREAMAAFLQRADPLLNPAG